MKVVNKGYTLKVTSWKNDGDDYRTKQLTVGTLEKAKMLHHLCTVLFKSCNNGEGGIGNSTSYNKKLEETISDYFDKYKELYSSVVDNLEDFKDWFGDYAYDLMGSSEYYIYRVCESCVVFYSPEDVYCENINFE